MANPRSLPAADDIRRLLGADHQLSVHVTPNAKAEAISIQTRQDGAPPVLQVRVTVPPEDGKANAAVVELLAKALGIRRTALTIARGQTGRHKVIKIDEAAFGR